ncbi:MAG: GAF domain-containing protein [Chloroflexi bacterium]|nr:GAF domain-containing protein [Chloroflexota bacterium]
MPNERILILEDHADLRAEAKQILAGAGYRVETAESGADAMLVARRAAFDVLLADVYLPDGTGMEIFQKLRALHPDLAGIVMTGFSTWEVAMDALRAGFVSFLVKPFVPEQLVTAIVSALEQEKLRRENARLNALVPLYEVSRAFMGMIELDELLNKIVVTAQKESRAETVSLMLLDDDRRELRIAAAVGLPRAVIETQRIALGEGIAGRVAQRGEPLMLAEGLPLDPEVQRAMGKPEILSALSLPLTTRAQVIGVLNLSRKRGAEPFTLAALEFATVLASQAAVAIEQTRLIKQFAQLSEISQRLARAADLDQVIKEIIAAPALVVNARGAVLWLNDGAVNPKSFPSASLANIPIPPIGSERAARDSDSQWLTLTLKSGEKILGALQVCFKTNTPPSEDRIGLLQTLAHSAAAVIETQRLRERETQAFREVDRAVRADLNVRQLLDRLMQQMIGVCEAHGGAIFLWDDARNRIELWVASGDAPNEELVRTVIHSGNARLYTEPINAIAAPLVVGTRVVGAAMLTRARGEKNFEPRHADLLSALTSSAALIVRNAQLYARSEEAAITEERTRIAREIHDGLAQDLSLMVLKVSLAMRWMEKGDAQELKRELLELSEQMRRDAREVRRVIFALRPPEIEALGFVPALEKFVREFGLSNELKTHLQVRGESGAFSPKLETALFRLTQESLNNIRKHAQAQNAWIELEFRAGSAHLSARDDGAGFEIEKVLHAAQARGSVGLRQMRERAERAGGKFSIESAPGSGTRIQIELPIKEI